MAATTRPKAGSTAKRENSGNTEISLFITDERMLDVKDYCIQQRISGIDTNAKWFEAIGISPTNQSNYTSGNSGFTKHHHQAVGKLFGVSMDFIYGFTDTMFRSPQSAYTSTDIIENMRTSLALLEMDLRLKASAGAVSEDFTEGNTSGNTRPKKAPKTKTSKN